MSSFKLLRQSIRQKLIESARQHRCIDGRLVDPESEDCYFDICLRIDDALFYRDALSSGTANRAYYNGVLADLRKKRRRLGKLYESAELQQQYRGSVPDEDWNVLSAQGERDLTKYNLTKSGKQLTGTRRKLKKFWNENADHSFFQGDAIECVHWIGWLRGMESGIAGLDRFIHYNTPASLGGGVTRDELSSVGYVNTQPSARGANMIGIKLSPRRITFAAVSDAYTEELHRASTYQRKKMAGSGLPKRPGPVSPHNVIFDESDLNGADYIDEVVCDNWNFDTIYIGDYWLDESEKRQVIVMAQALGLKIKYFDGSDAPNIARKDAIVRLEQEYPRLRVADLIKKKMNSK
jgi:hypothetical protein